MYYPFNHCPDSTDSIISHIIKSQQATTFASPEHQYVDAFWQVFPLWSLIVHWVLKQFCILALGEDSFWSPEQPSPSAVSRTYLKHARRVYTFASNTISSISSKS